MNVIFVTHYAKLYGANRSLLTLIKNLKKNYNVNPFVIVPKEGDMIDELRKYNIEYEIIPIRLWMSGGSKLRSPIRMLLNIYYIFHYRNRLKNLVPSIIYTNTSVTPFGIILAKYLRIPHVWHIREYGEEDYKLKYDFGKWFFKKILSYSTFIVCISKDLFYKKIDPISVPHKIVYNGITEKDKLKQNFSIFQINNKAAYGKYDEFNISVIGMLREEKGQHLAIKSFSKFLNKDRNLPVKLNVIGDGSNEYTSYLKRIVKNNSIKDKIKFTGYVNDPYPYFEKSHIILMCSGNEALGRVTLEAMSLGKIVIGLDSGGTSEIINHKVNGFLFDGTEDDLANKIEYVYQNYSSLNLIRENAFGTINSNFLIEDYVENIYEVLEEVRNVV